MEVPIVNVNMVNFPYKTNQRLVIELNCGQIFEGDVIKSSPKWIDIVEVMEYPSRTKLPVGTITLYKTEIKCIKTLVKKLQFPVEDHIIKLPISKYESILQMAADYIYFPVIDSRYLRAIDDLKESETIGVVGLWSKYARFRALDLLVFSTNCKIYLFDLKLFRKKIFPSELKEILESKYQQKVVHDAEKIADSLLHCHNVQLNNVFDTQVADVQIVFDSNCKMYRSLSVCLSGCFNVPGILNDTLKVTEVEWQERPLTDLRKEQLARQATFLIPIKKRQEELLLKRYDNSENKE